MTTASQPRVIAAFVITALIWGSTWLVIKAQIGPVPPSWSVTWRFAGAAIGMAALALARGDIAWRSPLPERAVLVRAAQIGAFVFCGNFQLIYRAESHITSGLVAVVFALLFFPNAIIARVFLGSRITRGFVGGSVVAIGGIALLMLNEYRTAGAGSDVPLGAAMTVLAMLSASAGNVLQASEVARRVPATVLLTWGFAIGAGIDAVIAWGISGPPVFDFSPVYAGAVVYLALVGSVMTFPLYNLLLREWGPGPAAYNGVVVPVVAMGLSTAFEGYRWTSLAAGGAVLSMAGLIIALRARRV